MNQYDVIIVGAGICGLTAAIELGARGKRVLVLEADSEAGGRTKSLTLPNGVIINTGAHWFHGGDDNPFYKWASGRYDLGPVILDRAKNKIFVSDKPNPEKIYEQAMNALDEAYERFKTRGGADESMAEIARLTGSQDAIEMASYMATGWMAGDSAEKISAKDYFEDAMGPGGWQMQRGIAHLIHQMEAEATRLGAVFLYDHAVQSVMNDSDGARVRTSQGDFSAAFVISTVSVDVLRNGSMGFDAPVKNAIDRKLQGLSMGNLFKAIIPLKEEFFRQSGIRADTSVYAMSQRMPCYINARTGDAPIITLFTGGQRARIMETWTNEAMEEFVRDVFSHIPAFATFEGHRDGEIFMTHWHRNPHTLGAYAVCEPHHARPDPFLCGNLCISGEALLADNTDSPGQMTGAWEAGRRAAHLCLKA